MSLDLIDLGDGRVVDDQVQQPVGVEVGDADRPRQALPVGLLHRAPLAVDVAVGLVHQVQVDVVESELGQGCLQGAAGVVLGGGVLDPELGGDEQVLAGDAAVLDRVADGVLVAVGGGGVQQPVAGGEGIGDGLLGLVGGDLVDAEAEDGHPDAVVQGDVLHGGGPSSFECVVGAPSRSPGKAAASVTRVCGRRSAVSLFRAPTDRVTAGRSWVEEERTGLPGS